jgi:hypothetical protein
MSKQITEVPMKKGYKCGGSTKKGYETGGTVQKSGKAKKGYKMGSTVSQTMCSPRKQMAMGNG